MACAWRRAVASVFLYLSLHNVHVLCQNVPSSTRTLPLLKEPLRDEALLNSGPILQQKKQLLPPSNAIQSQPSNGFRSDIKQRASYNARCQRPPEPRQTRSQSDFGQYSSRSDVPVNRFSQVPGPACNALPNLPQQTLANIKSNSAQSNPTFGPSLAPRTFTTQGIPSVTSTPQAPLARNTNSNLSLQPVSSVPSNTIVPNIQNQNQAAPCPQNTLIGSNLNLSPATLQNPSAQPFSAINPQSFVSTTPCLSTELKSLKFLATPNIPSIATQNYVPTQQFPVQRVTYPQTIENTACLPNYQVSALPPVYPANKPSCDCFRNPTSVTGEYTPVPINLQITVPTPTVPEPQITVITAYPQAPETPVSATTERSDLFVGGLYPPYPLPPIIIEGRRSRSRSWWPLILIALIANDDFGGNNCCCCCPCPDTPIPYPIPIPTNNPIILGARSRKKGTKSKTTVKAKVVNKN